MALLPDRLRGNEFAFLGLAQAMGDPGATVVVGVPWAAVSLTVAFLSATV